MVKNENSTYRLAGLVAELQRSEDRLGRPLDADWVGRRRRR